MIDFHTHIFPEKIVETTISFLERQCGEQAHLSGTYESLLSSMEEAKIEQSIVLPRKCCKITRKRLIFYG